MEIDWNDFAGKALAVLVTASVVIPVARPLVVRFKAFTKKTKNTIDDGIAWWALWVIDGLAAVVAAFLDVFPVISNRRMSRPPSDDHGSGIGGVPMLCLALAFSGALAGCHGGEVRDARMARTDYVLGAVESALLVTGQALVGPYQTAEAACAARPAGDYVPCTDPWNHAIDSLSAAYYATRAAREGLDSGRGAPVLPCIAGMLDAAVSAVGALDVELPDAVRSGMAAAQSLARLVSGACEVEP